MSFLKKIFSRDSFPNDVLSNGGFCSLKPELQERLSNGVKYNLKLVIRGERRTGKSSLLSRLKGEAFSPSYTPTDEIKVACILWNYQPTSAAVKVDVWDVVDKGRQREVKHGNISTGYVSKLTKKNQTTTAVASLDSSFIDVYKGANCVILIFDLTKRVTFEYVRRELPRVPYSVPVLVIGNFRDSAAGENEGLREVPESDVRALIQRAHKVRQAALSVVTPSDDLDLSDLRNLYKCAPIRYCETSMQNGFGLIYIHRFLNIPFLHLQCSYLIQGLVANRQALNESNQNLDLAEQNQEAICSYEKFTRWLESTRGQAAPGNPPRVDQVQSAIKSEELKYMKGPSSHQFVGKTEPVSNAGLPSNPEEDKSLYDFLNDNSCNSPLHSLPDKSLSMYENVDSNDSSANVVSVVAAFQEDLDPDDTAENLAALSFGLNGCTASPPPPVLRTANSSMDDIDDDDADLMNEDSDDDEEHLGPALGLTSASSPPLTVVNGGHLSPSIPLPEQKFQLPAFQSASSRSSSLSSSGSSSGKLSLEVDSTVFRSLSSHHTPEVRADFTTVEEKSAFERFLDGV